jgi:hypothetical protein
MKTGVVGRVKLLPFVAQALRVGKWLTSRTDCFVFRKDTTPFECDVNGRNPESVSTLQRIENKIFTMPECEPRIVVRINSNLVCVRCGKRREWHNNASTQIFGENVY